MSLLQEMCSKAILTLHGFSFQVRRQSSIRMRNSRESSSFPMFSKLSLHFFYPKRQWIRALFYFCIIMYVGLCYVSRKHLLPLARMLTNNKTIREVDNEHLKFTCIWSVVDRREKCKPRCGHGYFGLYGMTKCQPWLSCEEIDQLKMRGGIGHHGYVKEVQFFSVFV